MNWNKFELVDAGNQIVTPCLDIVAFTTQPMETNPQGLVAFYESFIGRYGDLVKFYQTNEMKRAKKITVKDLDMVKYWFSDETSLAEPLLGMRLHSGSTIKAISPPAFQFMFDQVYRAEVCRGGFRISLPIDSFSDTKSFIDLVSEALSGFPLSWGYAGYSFIWPELDVDLNDLATTWIAPFLKKHPGFSCGEIGEFLSAAETGVGNVGWLTMIGKEYIDKLALKNPMTLNLGKEITIHTPGNDIMLIQAGPTPEIGDVNRLDTLPNYHKVGEFLEPVRMPDSVMEEMVIEGLDDDDIVNWLMRFFTY